MGWFERLFRTSEQNLHVIEAPVVGFLNVLGSEGRELLATDRDAVSPFFHDAFESIELVPRCAVLFVYCAFDQRGKFRGHGGDLRWLVDESGAALIVVASDTPQEALGPALRTSSGRGVAIVVTLDRKADALPGFFHSLFSRMAHGKALTTAWTERVPADARRRDPGLPEAVMVAPDPRTRRTRMRLRKPADAWVPPVRASRQTMPAAPAVLDAIEAVRRVVLSYCTDLGGTPRPAERIAAVAAILGERCIEAHAPYEARHHAFIPGQAVFVPALNEVLSGDVPTDDVATLPADSIFGKLRDAIGGHAGPSSYPSATSVFECFAGGIGQPELWGRVPLSIPAEHWPAALPLRLAFDTRGAIVIHT